MPDHELKQECLALMETSEAAYLATVDPSGAPQIRAVSNLRRKQEFPSLAPLFQDHQEDFLVYIATNTSSNKLQQVRSNPAACVYYCVPSQFHGLMLEGSVEILDDPVTKRALFQPAWQQFWTGGPADPDYIVLRLQPRRARGWWWDKTFEFNLPGR